MAISCLFTKTVKLHPRSTNPSKGIIVADESDPSAGGILKSIGQSLLVPPGHVWDSSLNKRVTRLAYQLGDVYRGDRSPQNVSKWCTERSNASTLVTKFIDKYDLDMKLIGEPERLKFSQTCVKGPHLYYGNRPAFDVAGAIWRTLLALEFDS
ncbi:hypothetical protein HOY80DRAFT_1000467 [Tuber brumale]|nr:hypothetical protein HOY80DRAFT_1000467 [Tuber brumale]